MPLARVEQAKGAKSRNRSSGSATMPLQKFGRSIGGPRVGAAGSLRGGRLRMRIWILRRLFNGFVERHFVGPHFLVRRHGVSPYLCLLEAEWSAVLSSRVKDKRKLLANAGEDFEVIQLTLPALRSRLGSIMKFCFR